MAKKRKNELFEWVKALLGALAIVFIVRTFIFSPIVVDGESMNPTLVDAERMLVTKIGEPERFDIVVFHAPDGRDYIKRVIGLPGDKIHYKDDVLYINGKAYEEPYLTPFKEKLNGDVLTYPFTLEDTAVGSKTVPKDHLFVMGDNRRDSRDSREIGAVHYDKIIGTTNIVFYPFEEIKIIKTP
ncbi:signal peptidase I [Fictibacillus iocasae]|uniref:Signal peptidase I n=1 Tax=Fictibacillus iocasae TaxID=2715437 RepID=A0ABW2NWP5_9BACL